MPGNGSPSTTRPATGRLRRAAHDAAVLSGLAGLAVTQPVLDLFGRHPTFFVAGHYTRAQIVAFAVGVAVVPGLAALAVTRLAALAGPRAAAAARLLAMGALAGLFGLVVCRTVGIDGLVPAGAVAVASGAGVATLERRWRPARRFLAYLALGNVAFLGLFLVASPTAALLRPADAGVGGVRDMPPLEGPVVVVVLDGFPLHPLLDEDGAVDRHRYPNIARLAAASTWFRDAAAESAHTYRSVPSILTGRLVSEDRVPTRRDHPRNLFTLLGDRYPVRAYEPVTSLCPPSLCPPERRATPRQLLGDVGVAYGHRVLPGRLRARLPAVDNSWGRFGDGWGIQASVTADGGWNMAGKIDELGEDGFDDEGFDPVSQAAVFRREVAEIGPDPAVRFIHVTLPHRPYRLTPWGAVLANTWMPRDVTVEPGEPGHAVVYRDISALQALQIGAVDRLVGELLDHLEAVGAWDEALVVVTSDHGSEVMEPALDRPVPPGREDEVLRIPLFVKAPGQRAGEVRDDPASTLDVLPTVVDLLGAETDWTFDGHSLLDGSRPHTPRRLRSGLADALALAARHNAQFPGGGWLGLARVGAAADLVGSDVADHTVGAASALRWSADRDELLEDLAPDTGPVPLLLTGTVSGPAGGPAPELAVAVDGRIAGTLAAYQREGGSWRASGIMAPYFRPGRNDVTAYEVEATPSGVVLHPVPPE